ncbi:MAG: tRNA epoxyqueuosine(34) reductase QueG [Acidobacteriota bacterium]
MNAGLTDTQKSGTPLISLDDVRPLALTAGFTEAGVVSLPHANSARDAERFEYWIHERRAGSMSYLERTNHANKLVRARPDIPFPWARSAIVCVANYNSAQPRSTDPAREDAAWIARYAWSSRIDPQRGRVPSDYHKVLLKRLKSLDAKLREQYGAFESRAYVDTGPIVERSLAVAAGLGWSAKNTCLIHPKLGSFAFLCVLLTSLDVQDVKAPTVQVPDRCGSCTRCIEACPTGALIAPYQLDARLCISYLTIEHRGPIEPNLMAQMGRQVFGCDICQDVCPWNRKAPIAVDDELAARPELVNPALEWLASLDEQAFESTFNGSPVRRAGFHGLRRNIAIAIGNGTPSAAIAARWRASLRAWADAADEGLRTAAQWALARLREPE